MPMLVRLLKGNITLACSMCKATDCIAASRASESRYRSMDSRQQKEEQQDGRPAI